MLDSNAIITLVMGSSPRLVARAGECDDSDLVTSAVAFAEVVYGSMQAKPPAVDQLRAFVEEVPVLDFDYKAALAYATLPVKRASYDRLIAAHALSHDLILVTDNRKHFTDITHLKVENWTQ
ncbi:type II toxin-antitoxin system VapC family toxin [Sphingomonas sp. PB2P19]|uniref:type II toxin-antitoxin system VapC family toxin n=1 Tax=Sphingomonas rhamnosi TaxID=3096156 RepID=UPI002FC62C8C